MKSWLHYDQPELFDKMLNAQAVCLGDHKNILREPRISCWPKIVRLFGLVG